MMKKIFMRWRFKNLPTPTDITALIDKGVITKEEAREILFNLETDEENEERDNESLKSEIKFLRELVEKLAKRSEIVTTIKEVEVPYIPYRWYKPYVVWCGSNSNYTASGITLTSGNENFTNISTF